MTADPIADPEPPMPPAPSPPPHGREIELKLAVDPADLAVLARLLGAAAPAQRLESVYYDTEDLRLARAGFGLRVRRQGRRRIQTVKTTGRAALSLSDRDEWEQAAPDGAPDLQAVTDPTARRLLARAGFAALGRNDLKALFTTRIHRRIHHIEREGGRIEVALDRGEIAVEGGATLPVSEIELELKSGPVGLLFDVALELAAAAPLRIEPQSKAARGYALATGTMPVAAKAGTPDIADDATVEAAMAAIMHHCLGHLTRNIACARDGRDPEGVHQARVALRRLRSAFGLFRPLLPPEQSDWLSGEAKWLATTLSAARDWDVFLTQTLAPVAAAFAGNPDIALLQRTAEAARDAGREATRAALGSRRATAFLLGVGRWLETAEWRRQALSQEAALLFAPAHGWTAGALDKRRKVALKRGRHFSRLDADARHQLRIALKKLRYAAEFFRPLFPGRAADRYIGRLAAFQDELGRMNDAAIAASLLRDLDGGGPDERLALARAGGLVAGWYSRDVQDGDRLKDLWHRLRDQKPFWHSHIL